MAEPTPPELSVEVWPQAAENAGCTASAASFRSHRSVDTDDNEYYYFDYQLTATEAGGWRFDHFEWMQYETLNGVVSDPENHSRTDNPTSTDWPYPQVGKYWFELDYQEYLREYSVAGLRAVFTNNPEYTITTKAVKPNFGTTTGDGTYEEGASCTITATPAQGFRFSHWKCVETGETVGTATHTFTVYGESTWEAYFGTGLLIYLDALPPPPTDPGDAVVTIDFYPKTWVCETEHITHQISVRLYSRWDAGQTVDTTATAQYSFTIPITTLKATHSFTLEIKALDGGCIYTPSQEPYPEVHLYAVVQQANVATLTRDGTRRAEADWNTILGTADDGRISSLTPSPV